MYKSIIWGSVFLGALVASVSPVVSSAYSSSHQHSSYNNHSQWHGYKPPTPAPKPTPQPLPQPAPQPNPAPTSTPPQAGEVRLIAYTTGYAAYDNTPRGSTAISNPVIHSAAGGTGTYSDPTTLAVGHSITGGKDTLDYPAGTKFYVPNLRRYFIVEDTCGDGSTPQNGPCHTGYQGHVWVDLYVGESLNPQVLTCEDAITDLHLVIINPASNYAVAAGPVYNGNTCATQYSDTVVTQ